MPKILVWDLPTRLFHALLASGVLAAYLIAEWSERGGPVFPWHSLIGLVLLPALLFRILWGFVGSRHARFRSFLYSPAEAGRYLVGVFTGRAARQVGHNPGSSYAIFLMLGLTLLAGVSGVWCGAGGGEAAAALHGACASTLITVVFLHVCGVILHMLRHRENIAWSMLTGRKEGATEERIASARPGAAAALLALVAVAAGSLAAGYSPAERRLTLPPTGLLLDLGRPAAEPNSDDSSDERDARN